MCERVRRKYTKPTMVIEQTIPFPDSGCVSCASSYSLHMRHQRNALKRLHARTHTRHLRTLFT